MSYISCDSDGIPNKALYKVLNKLVAKSAGRGLFSSHKIDTEQAGELKAASVFEDSVTDLEFLRFFPRLESLSIASSGLADITGLRFTPALKELVICQHALTDITALRYCPGITYLALETAAAPNKIKDFSPIGGLHDVSDLSLEDNGITDITWMSGLIRLEILGIAGNPIQDFSPLLVLDRLRDIDADAEQKALLDRLLPKVNVEV